MTVAAVVVAVWVLGMFPMAFLYGWAERIHPEQIDSTPRERRFVVAIWPLVAVLTPVMMCSRWLDRAYRAGCARGERKRPDAAGKTT